MTRLEKGQLYFLLLAVCLLNLFDMMSTLAWIKMLGLNLELNPLMRALFAIHPAAALALKFLTVGVFIMLILICSQHNYRFALRGTVFTAFLYTTLLFWHLLGPSL